MLADQSSPLRFRNVTDVSVIRTLPGPESCMSLLFVTGSQPTLPPSFLPAQYRHMYADTVTNQILDLCVCVFV